MKDSFVLYTRYRRQLKNLTMEQVGVLFIAILCYEAGDELPEMDSAVSVAFDFIRDDLDENDRKYEEKCRINAENGKRGGRPKKPNETEKTERFSENRTQAKKADNEYEYDYENDSESVSEYIPPKESKPVKHKYGEYKHVLLTDSDYKKLSEEFGENITLRAIKVVDEYCETSGKTYKNYNLVIRRWGIDRAKQGDRSNGRDSPYLDAIRNRVDIVDTWV